MNRKQFDDLIQMVNKEASVRIPTPWRQEILFQLTRDIKVSELLKILKECSDENGYSTTLQDIILKVPFYKF